LPANKTLAFGSKFAGGASEGFALIS